MGTEKLETIIDSIRKGNINEKTKVAIIENGTLSNQRIIKGEISDIVQKSRDENVRPPSIVIIGDTVTLSDTIGWYYQYYQSDSAP
jgi:siroheme synthase